MALALAACLAVAAVAPGAAAQNGAVLVRVDAVKTEPMSQTVPVIGRVVARQAGEVSARINGPVERFNVEVGDRVSAGDVLAVLNADSLQARRDLAESELAEAQAAVKTKQASLTLAQQDARRLEGLKKSAAFNQARYDDALQEVVIAKAEVSQARANTGTYAAELRLAEINLAYSEVRAPYPGVITQRLSEAGAYVQIGEPLLKMVADENLEIEADVPFKRISGLDPGTPVRVGLGDGSEHWAIVRAVVPEENPLTRTRAVRFVPQFTATDEPIAVAQSVTVMVPQGEPRKVLSVHKDAVIKRGEKDIVYVVLNDSAQIRTVRLGEAVGNRLEVLDGLSDGELAVVRGNERLQPGDPVRIDKET